MFKITKGCGMHMTFSNGYTVSVQFGVGYYCDNHDDILGVTDYKQAQIDAGRRGSYTAECAVLAPVTDELIKLSNGDIAQGYMTAEQVLQLMTWVSKLPSSTSQMEVLDK